MSEQLAMVPCFLSLLVVFFKKNFTLENLEVNFVFFLPIILIFKYARTTMSML